MFGRQEIPFEFTEEDTKISIRKDGKVINYVREYSEDTLEKSIISSKDTVLFTPVEPLNLPKQLTSALEIEYDKPVVLGPKQKTLFYLTFPVEIGVFINEREDPIDIFTFSKSKFTLYGDVKTGKICKYWNSPVLTEIPEVNPLYEGVLRLKLANATEGSIEVHLGVFSGYSMKIFYDEDMVYMDGEMMVRDEERSITDFSKKPLRDDMKRAIDVYKEKKQALKGVKYIMEGGI